MKFYCDRSELASAIQSASRAVTGTSTLAILTNVLLEASGEQIRVSGTDLGLSLRATVKASVEEEGAITVPAQLFQTVVSNFQTAEVTGVLEENTLHLIAGVSEYDILGMPADEYPSFPEVEADQRLQVAQGTLKQVIQRTVFACSKEDMRLIMTGALIEVEGQTIRIVGTDTHRLALAEAQLLEPAQIDVSVIVPAPALQALEQDLEADDELSAEIEISENLIRVSTEKRQMVSRLLDGLFPNYRRVIPKEREKRLILDRETFAIAVRNVAVVAQQNAKKVILESSGDTLSLRAESQAIGRGYEEMKVGVEGEEVQIAFNAEFLEEVLRTVDCETIFLDLSGSASPGVIRLEGDDSYLYVLMPMQLL